MIGNHVTMPRKGWSLLFGCGAHPAPSAPELLTLPHPICRVPNGQGHRIRV